MSLSLLSYARDGREVEEHKQKHACTAFSSLVVHQVCSHPSGLSGPIAECRVGAGGHYKQQKTEEGKN